MDSCSVGESKSTAYVEGLVEGVDVTVLIDSIPALRKSMLTVQLCHYWTH